MLHAQDRFVDEPERIDAAVALMELVEIALKVYF
jgi:hypothetical protein